MSGVKPEDIPEGEQLVVCCNPTSWNNVGVSGHTAKCQECGVEVDMSQSTYDFTSRCKPEQLIFLCLPCTVKQAEDGSIETEMQEFEGQREEIEAHGLNYDQVRANMSNMPAREWGIEHWKEANDKYHALKAALEEITDKDR